MHCRKGIGILADAPAGLSSATHRLTREVEIKSNGKRNGKRKNNGNGNGDDNLKRDDRAQARFARCF